MNFIKDLIKMANHLDSSGHYKEADLVDQIIVKLSGDVLNFPGPSVRPRVEVSEEGAVGELIDFPQSGTAPKDSVTEPKPNDIKTLVEGKDEDDFEDLEPTSSGIKKVFKAGQQGEGLVNRPTPKQLQSQSTWIYGFSCDVPCKAKQHLTDESNQDGGPEPQSPRKTDKQS